MKICDGLRLLNVYTKANRDIYLGYCQGRIQHLMMLHKGMKLKRSKQKRSGHAFRKKCFRIANHVLFKQKESPKPKSVIHHEQILKPLKTEASAGKAYRMSHKLRKYSWLHLYAKERCESKLKHSYALKHMKYYPLRFSQNLQVHPYTQDIVEGQRKLQYNYCRSMRPDEKHLTMLVDSRVILIQRMARCWFKSRLRAVLKIQLIYRQKLKCSSTFN
jgi:hypothetical protein